MILLQLLPLLFIALILLFTYLSIFSRKPVYNNPVVFNDGGNIWWMIATGFSFIGFVASLVVLGSQ